MAFVTRAVMHDLTKAFDCVSTDMSWNITE